MSAPSIREFVTLGMFIIDEFSYTDADGIATKVSTSQESGGGTYAAVGCAIWLSPQQVGMIVDKGYDFPPEIEHNLKQYGEDMWLLREQKDNPTTRALNSYKGEQRGFEYLTPRIRITPRDLVNTKLDRPKMLHFICSPARASTILSEAGEVVGWSPITIYEPIPDRCVPEELPELLKVLPSIDILSPNAEEALSLLSIVQPVTRPSVEGAARRLLELGAKNTVIIRSGGLGAYVLTRERGGRWVDAFWTESTEDASNIVDVTGAGNSFLGGLGAGLHLANGDVYEAVFYAAVSASFVIQQNGLPSMTKASDSNTIQWNNDLPLRRLELLRIRHRTE